MINFKREYIGLEQDRLLYPVSFKDKAKCNVYGRKKFITVAGKEEVSAHVFPISKEFWTFNAGQLDFTNYADGIWNDYISIVVVERGEYTAPSINFASMGDITPENLQELSEYTTKHLSDLEKRIVEDYLFIDEGTAENIGLPNLPENHFWVRKNGVIVGVNLDYLKIDYDYLKNNMEADFNTVSKKVYNVFKNNVDSYIVDKNKELQGATFFPHLIEDGTLSWTNDKNKPNPEPVNIKGPSGTIENVTASVNSNAGVPSVKVTMSGTKENRSFNLDFQNLKGDKPIKGTDYYTPAEKEQFTTEMVGIVKSEGNKVVEQVKNIVAGNPATTNALTLSGKTRVEFEQDTENLRNDCNENLGNFKIISGHALAGDYKWIELNQNVAENTTVYIDSYINSTKSYTIALYSDNDGTKKKLASFVNDNVRFTIPYFTKKLEAVIGGISEEVDYKFIYREIKDKTIFGMALKNQDNNNSLKKAVDKNSKELKEKLYIPYLNLIDKNKCELSKSIYQEDGKTRESEFFNATDYILLRANTKYYGFGMFATSLYAFYDVDTKQFLNSADVKVTKTSSDYNCTIEVGGSDVYFRCSINKSYIEKSYISQYVDSYYQYGEYDTSFISKIHQEKIKVLEDKNKVLEDKVNSITKTGENLIDKKVLVIGDSISTDDYGNYKKWVTHLIEEGFFNKANVTNSSFHATGFVADYIEGDYHSGTFIERLTKITEKEIYDLVIIFGGINDFIDPRQNIEWTMFTGAVDNFFEYLINNFTQARICVLRPLRTYNIYPNKHTKKLQQEYSEYINTVAKKYCLPVLNLTEDSGFCPFVDSFNKKWTLIPKGFNSNDGVHPNEQYEKEFLAPMIKKFLLSLG